MGGCSQIYEVSSTTNTGCSDCHLWGTVHTTCWDRGLSKFQTLVCLIWWSFQPNIPVPWTLPIGEPTTPLHAADITNVKCNRLSRWKYFQQQLKQFWQRWSADYFQNLQQRTRWMKTTPNLQPGALDLLREDNTTPLHWPTAVVTNTHPGKDGIVRVVTIRTPKGVFKCPITKICPLPCESDDP